jgi:hypothetical protein
MELMRDIIVLITQLEVLRDQDGISVSGQNLRYFGKFLPLYHKRK